MGEPVPAFAAVCATAGCPEDGVPEDEVPGWEEEAGEPEELCAVSAGLVGVGFTLCRTFLGGGGGGSGTVCADGGGRGEARGVSDFSCCCVVLGEVSVPFPVCSGGAWACWGGDEFLCEHAVQHMVSKLTTE